VKVAWIVAALMMAAPVSAATEAAPVPIVAAAGLEEGDLRAGQVAAAIAGSPALSAELRTLVAGGLLKEIRILPPDQALQRQGRQLHGWQDGGVIHFTADIVERFSTAEKSERFPNLDYSTNNPNDLTFLVGFMASRVENAASLNSDISAIKSRMQQDASKASGTSFDATNMVREFLSVQLTDVSKAYIAGWTAMRDGAEAKNGKKFDLPTFSRMMMKSRTFDLMNASVNKPGFALRSDGYIADTPENVQAVTLALMQAPMPDFD
jgi:hypothetical protein